jgi:hypothetical protein
LKNSKVFYERIICDAGIKALVDILQLKDDFLATTKQRKLVKGAIPSIFKENFHI